MDRALQPVAQELPPSAEGQVWDGLLSAGQLRAGLEPAIVNVIRVMQRDLLARTSAWARVMSPASSAAATRPMSLRTWSSRSESPARSAFNAANSQQYHNPRSHTHGGES